MSEHPQSNDLTFVGDIASDSMSILAPAIDANCYVYKKHRPFKFYFTGLINPRRVTIIKIAKVTENQESEVACIPWQDIVSK